MMKIGPIAAANYGDAIKTLTDREFIAQMQRAAARQDAQSNAAHNRLILAALKQNHARSVTK